MHNIGFVFQNGGQESVPFKRSGTAVWSHEVPPKVGSCSSVHALREAVEEVVKKMAKKIQ